MQPLIAPAPALLRAYRQTAYQAAGIDIRIGRRSATADRLLRARGARTAVLITAYNPFSRRMPPGWNVRMQHRLGQSLRRYDLLCGRGTLGRWSEDHWLVFGDPRPIQRLARLFRQSGTVIICRGRPGRLVMGAG